MAKQSCSPHDQNAKERGKNWASSTLLPGPSDWSPPTKLYFSKTLLSPDGAKLGFKPLTPASVGNIPDPTYSISLSIKSKSTKKA
jgi:hypothetical protein